MYKRQTVDNEGPLFDTLIEKECFDELEIVANKFIPAAIIHDLESVVIGELIELYTMSKKTELIASLEDESLKERIIVSFAPEGSTAKEMLMLELENYDSDLTLQKHIKENRSDIWQQYVNHCRKMMTSKVKFDESREQMVKDWVASKKGKSDDLGQLTDFEDAA